MNEVKTRYVNGKLATPKRNGPPRDRAERALLIAGRVRLCRTALNYTPTSLSAALDGVTKNQVASWERYFGAELESRYAAAIANVFNVSVEWLTNGVGPSGLPAHINDSKIETPLTVQMREAAGRRAMDRRRSLGIDSTPFNCQMGISYFQLCKWEDALPIYRNALEDAWEDALKVPRGWLRDFSDEEMLALAA